MFIGFICSKYIPIEAEEKLLKKREGYRKTCFDDVKDDDIFSITLEGTDGVFIKNFALTNEVANHTISINGNSSFWYFIG